MAEKDPNETFLEELKTILGAPVRQNALEKEQLKQLKGMVCEPHFQLLEKYMEPLSFAKDACGY